MVKTITQEIGISPATIRSQVRYKALWIKEQYVDANGEGSPDKDEFSSSYHLTRKAAESAALIASKKSGYEWFLIAEQKHIGHEWIDQCRWAGDWSGIVDLTFTSDEVE